MLSSLDPGLLVINTVWHKLVTNTWTTNKQESNNICELVVSELCEVLKVLGFRFRVTNGEYAALCTLFLNNSEVSDSGNIRSWDSSNK